VGEKTPFNFYHSTIKRYETGRNGVHEVDLKEELLSRGKNLVILVVRPFKDKVFTTAVVNAAKKFKREQLKYSTIDALSSAL
jgi:hypothetical protein